MFRVSATRFARLSTKVRNFGAGHGDGHGHDTFHAPPFATAVGKGLLVFCYLWVMFSFKANKGQVFNLYHPWLHEHEHHHFSFKTDVVGSMPVLDDHHDENHGEDAHGHH